MTYIDEKLKDSSNINYKIPNSIDDSGLTIYINGRDNGYKLVDSNDRVYTKQGREVSYNL